MISKVRNTLKILVMGLKLPFFALLLSFSGCASGPEIRLLPGGEEETSTNLYGNYLAGRFAGAVRDNKQANEFYEQALLQDPGSNVILERAFLLNIASGEIEKSAELAQDIVKTDSANPVARMVLALRSYKEEAYADTRLHLSQSRLGPLNTIVRDLLVAWSYAAEGDREQALASLEEGANSNLGVFYITTRAHILDYFGESEGAAKDYASAMQYSDGRSLTLVLAYGSLLERSERHDEARALYADYASYLAGSELGVQLQRRAQSGSIEPIKIRPNEGVALAIYGPAAFLAQERAVDLPMAYLQLALYADPDFHIGRALLADLFETTEQWSEAVDSYRAIPKSSLLHHSSQIRIAINLDRMDRTDQAIRMLDDLVSEEARTDIDVLITLGDMLRFRERYDEAAEIYTRAIESIGPNYEESDWLLFYVRGVAFERMKDWPKAEVDLLKALEISPNQPLALNYLGYSWIDQGVNLKRGMEYIKMAVSLKPDDGFIIDSLGWAYYKQGDYATAVQYLERAVELEPTDPVINEHLGDAYWKVGRTLEARFQWNHALSLGPDEDLIPVIERKLESGLRDI